MSQGASKRTATENYRVLTLIRSFWKHVSDSFWHTKSIKMMTKRHGISNAKGVENACKVGSQIEQPLRSKHIEILYWKKIEVNEKHDLLKIPGKSSSI